MTLSRKTLEAYAAKHKARFEELLKEFVEIPSVSADPDRKRDLERCAELGLETVRAFGGKADLHRVPGGPPVLLGSFETGKACPTLTIYNHRHAKENQNQTVPPAK